MKRWMLVLVLLVACSVAQAAVVTTTSTPETVPPGQVYTVTSRVELEPWKTILCVTMFSAENAEPVVVTAETQVGEPLHGASLSTRVPVDTEFVRAEATDQSGATVTVSPDVGGVVSYLFGEIQPGQAVALAVVLAVM